MFDKIKNLFKSKFAKDTIWLTFAQIVLILSGLSVNLIIGTNFGEASLGVFNQVLSLYVICAVLFSLGMNASLVQKIAYAEKRMIKHIFSSGILITALSAILFSFVFYVVINVWPVLLSSEEVKVGFSMTLIGLPFFTMNKNFQSLYSGQKNQKSFSIIRGMRWLIICAILIINAFFIKEMYINFLALPITEVLIFLFLLFLNLPYLTIKVKRNYLLENMNFGVRSYIAELFTILNDRLDIVIIGYFLTQTETGLYSFYIFFVKALFIFPGILNQNFKPIFSKQWNSKNIALLNDSIKKIRKINALITIVTAVFIIIGYYILVNFFYLEYNTTYIYLLIGVIAAVPSALISWGGGLLLMAGKLNENMLRTLTILVFNVLVLIFLTHFFGFTGAAIGTCVMFLFGFIMLNTFVKRVIGIKLI
tara:strand:+ start:13549 stop:14811 length:1263 start_codon:yes stop_codon:yes gene_type:complete